jgi:uncharacterized protein
LIYYLDTSALAKRYVSELGSAAVRGLFRRKRQITVASITYGELAAAVARRWREGILTLERRDSILEQVRADFTAMTVWEVRSSVLRDVPPLVIRNPLRGYDAVQLAVALSASRSGASLDFWSADAGLVRAARHEGVRATLLA